MIAPLVKRSRPSYSGLGSSVYAYEFDEKHFAEGMKRLGRDVLKGEVGDEVRIGGARVRAEMNLPFSFNAEGDSVKLKVGYGGAGIEIAIPKTEPLPPSPQTGTGKTPCNFCPIPLED